MSARTPSGGDTPYRSSSQQLLLRVVGALTPDPLTPKTVATLAGTLDEPRDSVFRTLRNLQLADWAAEVPGVGWRLTPQSMRAGEELRGAVADTIRAYLPGEVAK